MRRAESIILLELFKIRLRMGADRTDLRRLRRFADVAAVAALPDAVALTREYYAILDVLQSDSRIDISLCWGTGKDTNFLYFLEKSKLLNDSIINSIHRLFASQ